MANEKQKQALQRKILSWYKKHRRSLPWRRTTDAYRILVAEVMLQQTQVERVIPYYLRFVRHYPTITSLARARRSTLLKLWSGLGYNSRVLRLQQLAKAVVSGHNSRLPRTEQGLLALPGIGPCTAHAIMAFAYNMEVPVIDTNIRRVLLHGLGLRKNTGIDRLQHIAQSLIPKGKSRIWHNALMDYGALVLTSQRTGIAPVSRQGRFHGSDREVRGYVVRELIRRRRLSMDAVKKRFRGKNVRGIAKKMEREGFIAVQNGFLGIR